MDKPVGFWIAIFLILALFGGWFLLLSEVVGARFI